MQATTRSLLGPCRSCGPAAIGLQTRSFASSQAHASHVGSMPVSCPPQVTLELQKPARASTSNSGSPVAASRQLRVAGPKGSLFIDLMPFVQLSKIDNDDVSGSAAQAAAAAYTVNVENPAVKHQRAVWGLTRSLLANAVTGVSTGYTLSLRLVGVGYRAAIEDVPANASSSPTADRPRRRLNLKLGYAHPVYVDVPNDIQATTPSSTTVVLEGIDKQRLGELAARIRRWRIPEPYNGKGIFVGDEVIRRKEVKKK